MKNINIVIPGADESADIHDLQMEPGTTAADALQAINKDPNAWQLQRKGADGFQTIATRDNLYDTAKEGEKLFAVPKDIVVG